MTLVLFAIGPVEIARTLKVLGLSLLYFLQLDKVELLGTRSGCQQTILRA
jgi:hypothetical protein